MIKEEKRKILIIGVGGIGSYLTPLLHKTGLYDLCISDPDIVEEKNLYYQNFNTSHLGKTKVSCIVENDGIGVRNPYPILTDVQLKGYDLVVCCADNLDARRLVYRQGFQDGVKTRWLDLRAQGRNGALISYQADPKFSDTFLAGEEGSFSCQGESFNDTTKKQNLHFTHVAIAGIGAQWIQRFFNDEQVKDKMVINI
jgi:molybdopterin/thiamine biosynthesis adenylyltransferase